MSRINFNRSSVPLVLAFLLLASGSVFLVENLTNTAAWSIILPWWPILLLVMGAWAIARGTANQLRSETASVWLWFGEVVFALVIIGAGLAANFLTTTDWDLGFLEPPLVSTTKTVVRTVDFSGSRLIADNPSGRIKVIGWERPQTRISLEMTAGGATMRSARRRLSKQARPLIKRSGNNLRISIKKQRLEAEAVKIPELTIRMPKSTAVRLKAYGRVTVTGTKAAVSADSVVGRVRVERVTGPVTVRGDLGDINIDHAAGKVNVWSSAGHISVSDADGPVAAANEGGSIRINRAQADITADNLNGPIEIVDPGGAVNANTKVNSQGQVAISASDLLGDWRVRSETGPIMIKLPRAAGFSLDALSEFGQFETSFFRHRVREPGRGDGVKRKLNGGGPLIHLRTNNGNISVLSGE